MKKEVLIFGAGKIGRGFIGQLFYESGYSLWFVDASQNTVALLNKEKKYRVDIAKKGQDLTWYIRVEGAFQLDEKENISKKFEDVDIIVTSVGAENITKLAGYIRELLVITRRDKILNWLICENASNPAKKIKETLLRDGDAKVQAFVTTKLGLIETQVLRTGMLAVKEVAASYPLAVRMQDWWTLPLDKDAFIGPIPPVKGFVPKSDFSNELVRKLYTFNGTNGPIAYVGWANGYHLLHESALAYPAFFKNIQEESAYGLINEFGLDENEQRQFMALAMAKYTDPTINDQVERNANDTRRKLGKEERLVGPALLCLKHGRMPYAYAKAIAAAYYYKGSDDEGTREVQETINRTGIEIAISKYSSIDESCALYKLILASYLSKDFIF